jgi:hypothetical protein
MSQIIKTKLPKNLNQKKTSPFQNRIRYKMPLLKTRTLKNVFLTHGGVLIKNLLTIRHSLPNAYGFRKPNAGFIYQFYRKGVEIFLVCKFGKSLKSIKLDTEKQYLFVFSPWFGYFSWVTESLPRIYSVKRIHKELTLILPETYSKKKFVMNSLEMFPNLKYEIIPEGIHMEIPNITMPELKPFTYTFDPKTMKEYRQKVWDFVEEINFEIQTYNKIYVSRKKAKNRKLVNEEDVSAIIAEYGYKELCFEDYSFFEQVYLMRNCKVLAGVHGAGFANICFLPENSILFEMIKEYSSYKEERPSYWRLCSALKIDYYIQYCKHIKYGNYDLWVGVNLIADIDQLKNNLTTID